MKRLFPIIMLLLTALSVGGVVLYTVHRNAATGGASPEIRFDRETIEISTGAGDQALLAGVTAVDAEDGDVTDSLMVEGISRLVGDAAVQVTYVAYDSQNHVTRAGRTAHYIDYHAPRFTMGAPMVFLSKNVGDLTEKLGAEDAVDGNISLKAHASFDDTTSALTSVGEHTVTLTVTNSLGDTARLDVPVLVVEDNPHTENLPLKTYLVYLERGAAFDPLFYLTNADQRESEELQINSKVDTAIAGVYTVDYQMIKNDAVSAMTRLLVVVE